LYCVSQASGFSRQPASSRNCFVANSPTPQTALSAVMANVFIPDFFLIK
jgi:hypothetical protein